MSGHFTIKAEQYPQWVKVLPCQDSHNGQDKIYIAPLVSAGRNLFLEAPGSFMVHIFSSHLISHLQSSQIFS